MCRVSRLQQLGLNTPIPCIRDFLCRLRAQHARNAHQQRVPEELVSGAGERGAAAASDGTGQDRRLSSSLTIYIPLHLQDWASWKFILVWECVQAKHNVRLLQSLEISVWFHGLFQGFQFLCPVREMLQKMEWTALLSPQRCRWVLVKEDLLLQPETWHRHHFTALSDFNLMEPSLFKSHHSGLTTGVKIFNRNVSVCNYNWILQTSPFHYIAHAIISFSSVLVWEESRVYHQHELFCREFMRAGAQERNG